MENNKVFQEDFNPYVDKIVAKNDLLLKILLFIFFVAISAFSTYLDKKPTSFDAQNIISLFSFMIGSMVVIGILGYGIAYVFSRGKSKKERNKYWLICSIIVSLVLLISEISTKSNEVSNRPANEQKSIVNQLKSEQAAGKYYSSDGKYSVAFPKKPRNEKVNVDIPNLGKITFSYSILGNESDLYYVNYADMNVLKDMTEEQVKNQLVIIKNEVLEKIHGQLINSQFFKFASTSARNCNGIDFSADYQNQDNDNCIYIARVLVVKERLYTITVMTLKNQDFEKKATDFINSFIPFY